MTPDKLHTEAVKHLKKYHICPRSIKSVLLLKQAPKELPKCRMSVLLYTKIGLVYVSSGGRRYTKKCIPQDMILCTWENDVDYKNSYYAVSEKQRQHLRKYLTEYEHLVYK